MARYGVFQALYLSFFSKALYRDVARNWGSRSFLYLLILLTCASIVFTFQIQRSINLVYDAYSNTLAAQIPVLTISAGKLSTPENHPYLVKTPDTGETFMIVDTSGKFTSTKEAQTPILVTDTKLITQPKPNETKIYEFPANLNVVIDPRVVREKTDIYVSKMWLAIFPLCLLVSYIYRVLQALFYAVIGFIVSAICHIPLRYIQVLRIAMVAITPVIVICIILLFIPIKLAIYWYFLLAMGYICYGVLANK